MLIAIVALVALLVLACVADLADDRRLGRRSRRGTAWAELDTPGTDTPAMAGGAASGRAPTDEGELARRLLSGQLPAADYRRAMERLAAAGYVRHPLAPPA